MSVSIIVSAEIQFGLENRNGQFLRERTAQVLSRIAILPFAHPADVCYGRLRSTLKGLGKPIGPNDLLIAAHALAVNAILVTDNIREFSLVPGLEVENWLRH